MSHFYFQDNQAMAEHVALASIAEQYGTPTYVYSKAAFEENFLAYQKALTDPAHLICYAVKANSNIAILNLLASLGSGFDIVSIGELERVLLAGGDPKKVVFSGVAKTHREIERALEVGIKCFNVESQQELSRIADIAASHNVVAPISIRVNPDVDAQTHPYISTGLQENKFGIDINDAKGVYLEAAEMPALNIIGVDCHIGSQLTNLSPFYDALDRVLLLVDDLAEQGIAIEHIDAGGGLGVRYQDETPPEIPDFVAGLIDRIKGRNLGLILEPGRSISANAGILLTRVEFIKQNASKNFAIIDAAMNDMIRPALYNAWLDIQGG